MESHEETDYSDHKYCHKHMYWYPIKDGCKSCVMTGVINKASSDKIDDFDAIFAASAEFVQNRNSEVKE